MLVSTSAPLRASAYMLSNTMADEPVPFEDQVEGTDVGRCLAIRSLGGVHVCGANGLEQVGVEIRTWRPAKRGDLDCNASEIIRRIRQLVACTN